MKTVLYCHGKFLNKAAQNMCLSDLHPKAQILVPGTLTYYWFFIKGLKHKKLCLIFVFLYFLLYYKHQAIQSELKHMDQVFLTVTQKLPREDARLLYPVVYLKCCMAPAKVIDRFIHEQFSYCPLDGDER